MEGDSSHDDSPKLRAVGIMEHQQHVSKLPKRRMRAEEQRRSSVGERARSTPPPGASSGSEEESADHDRPQTKLEGVLRGLREDVVPLGRREGKARWRAMLEGTQQAGVGGGDGGMSHLRIEDELHHERVDTSQVGSDLYSNRWRKMTRYTTPFQRPSKPEAEPNNNAVKRVEPSEEAEGSQPVGCLWRLTHYFSGVLAGLLLWTALFAVSNVGGESLLIKGPAFLTVSSLVTTSIVLVVVVGCISSVFTLRGSVAEVERLLYHSVPVLLILVTHYLGKALELRGMECRALHRLPPESREKVHESYSCARYSQTGGDHDVGFVFLQLLPWLGAVGIFSYLHLAPPHRKGRQ